LVLSLDKDFEDELDDEEEELFSRFFFLSDLLFLGDLSFFLSVTLGF